MMSLVWMIMALGVSALTVVVVLQVLDGGTARFSSRLIAWAVGLLMLLEGAVVLFNRPGVADPTAFVQGVAMIVAGAGVLSVAHRDLWQVISSRTR